MIQKIQSQIVLITPTGKTSVPIQIVYDNDDERIQTPSEISLVYQNILYKGRGFDYLWVDTFADLQRQLPDSVQLACCMTCRHGNMCPYGSKVNQLFCTKDLVITSKSDMCNVFDNDDAYDKREVFSYGFCEDYGQQAADFYTYNDYLYT